jgi:vesicular inhibitory amino acid transporter
MLATPYALASSGLAALLLLPLLGAAACYTGNLIGACLQAAGSGASTYPDIGHRALGHTGRVLVSVLLYFELFSCCVEFLILDGDNLAAIFPQAELRWA